MKTRLTALPPLLLALFLLSSCKKEEQAATDVSMSTVAPPAQVAERAANAPQPSPPPSGQGAAHVSVVPQPQRMIVRTAQVSLVVSDTTKTFDKLSALVESFGGYVNDSKTWRDGEQVRATLSIRVPAPRLREALNAIRGLALRVQSEAVSGEDVTQEYVDLDSRVRNLEAAELEMRQLMTTVRERSKKADDILEVYEKLTSLRGEIEQAKGRMRYLSQMSAYSTINLELIPDVAAKAVVEPGWQPVAVVKDAVRALVATLQVATDAAIWLLLYLVPILLMPALIIFALARRLRGRKRSAVSVS